MRREVATIAAAWVYLAQQWMQREQVAAPLLLVSSSRFPQPSPLPTGRRDVDRRVGATQAQLGTATEICDKIIVPRTVPLYSIYEYNYIPIIIYCTVANRL